MALSLVIRCHYNWIKRINRKNLEVGNSGYMEGVRLPSGPSFGTFSRH